MSRHKTKRGANAHEGDRLKSSGNSESDRMRRRRMLGSLCLGESLAGSCPPPISLERRVEILEKIDPGAQKSHQQSLGIIKERKRRETNSEKK